MAKSEEMEDTLSKKSNDAEEQQPTRSNSMLEKQDEPPPPPPPETSQPPPSRSERLKPWRRVAGAWLLFFIAWGPALAYGSFQTYYKETTLSSYSDSQIAWIGSLATLLLVCAGAFAGPLFDRGYLRHILILGCVLLVFSFEMLSLCTEYYQLLLAQGVGYGLGSGLVYVPALAFVTVSFDAKTRPYALGVLTCSAGFAGVLYPIMFDQLVPQIGFGWTCRFFGFLALLLAVIGILLVWDAPTKTTKPRSLIDWHAFQELPFVTICFVFFLQFLAYWIPLFYVASFASSKLGVSSSGAQYFICYVNAGSIFGRLLPTPLVAAFGAFPIVLAATGLSAIILFCWIAVESYAGFVVWCIAIGFTTGMFVSVNPVVCSLPIISPPEVLGTRFGIIWFAAAMGALIGTPIAGALADPVTGMFLNAQIFTGCIMLGATIGLLGPWWLYERDRRRKASS